MSWHIERCRVLETERDALRRLSSRISHLRVVLFVSALGMLAWAESVRTDPTLQLIAFTALALLFGALVFYHQAVRRRIERNEAAYACHVDALHRIERAWSKLDPLPIEIPDQHPYAHDLDIGGRVSILSLLGSVRTPFGRAALARLLLKGIPAATIPERQNAVRELVGMRGLRERIEVVGRVSVRPTEKSIDSFLKWLAEPTRLLTRPGVRWLARAGGVATIALIVAHIAGWIPVALWLLPVMLNFVLSRKHASAVRESFMRVELGNSSLQACREIVRLFRAESYTSRRLTELHAELAHSVRGAETAIAELNRLAGWCGIRRSWINPVLQGLMVWDLHLLAALERWRAEWGRDAPRWFDVVGEVELLTALAGMADDNPTWCFPTFALEGRLVAQKLGHPLIADESRICNDVEVGPEATFLFVTGSNMSGKSTLLRAIGANVVLAQAGGPVCARSLQLPAVRLHTSMHVHDSLAQNESYFLAALRRLKLIVDDARRATADGGAPVLYLLDEILQGTNSAERGIAVTEIIKTLLSANAIGAITSHDLTLADDPDLREASVPVHFVERVTGEGETLEMTFDYRLRSGIAPSTNALLLMEKMGLRRPSHPKDDDRRPGEAFRSGTPGDPRGISAP